MANGYINKKTLEDFPPAPTLPQTSINFFNIACSFSTQSSLMTRLRLFCLTIRAVWHTCSYCSGVRVWKQKIHYMMESISGSLRVRYYQRTRYGVIQVSRERVFWTIVELGQLQIQVESMVSSPFSMQYRYKPRHRPPPKQLTIFLPLREYIHRRVHKLCTFSKLLSIMPTKSLKYLGSSRSTCSRSQARIFQDSQAGDWSSQLMEGRQVFQVFIFFLQWASWDVYWVSRVIEGWGCGLQ